MDETEPRRTFPKKGGGLSSGPSAAAFGSRGRGRGRGGRGRGGGTHAGRYFTIMAEQEKKGHHKARVQLDHAGSSPTPRKGVRDEEGKKKKKAGKKMRKKQKAKAVKAGAEVAVKNEMQVKHDFFDPDGDDSNNDLESVELPEDDMFSNEKESDSDSEIPTPRAENNYRKQLKQSSSFQISNMAKVEPNEEEGETDDEVEAAIEEDDEIEDDKGEIKYEKQEDEDNQLPDYGHNLREDDKDEIKDAKQEDEDNQLSDYGHNLREELSRLPLRKVREMKEKLGVKLFNAAFFGDEQAASSTAKFKSTFAPKDFKRKNPKRPREESSKQRVSSFRPIYANESLKKKKGFDPRFDERCGEFKEDLFENNYKFLDEIRSEETKEMKKKLLEAKKEGNAVEAERLKEMLRRRKNQEKSKQEKEIRKETVRELKQENIKRMNEGKQPVFLPRAQVKMRMMEKKFDQLKKDKSLDKYLRRKAKKQISKGPCPAPFVAREEN